MMYIGIILSYQKSAIRKQAYESDVTYVSNQELGFDFLRDNLAISLDEVGDGYAHPLLFSSSCEICFNNGPYLSILLLIFNVL